MTEHHDVLDQQELARRVRTRWLGHRHVHVTTCSSTNDLVAVEARRGISEGFLVTADEQTGGRGRQGRAWHSPFGTNIYASLLLRPRRPAQEIPPMTLLVGGALAQALDGLGFDVRVKWPNDLLLRCADGRRRKVAGILTEATTEGERMGHVVVGFGVNVNAVDFPDALAARATSLRLAGNEAVAAALLSRAEILARLLEALEAAYERFQETGVAAAISLWEMHADLGRPCRVRVDGREISGVMAGVAEDGALLVEESNGIRSRIVAGEISLLMLDS